MKTIAIFSEKGGVGKSSISILYASWLQYKYGIKTALADFNDRITGYRIAEIENRNELRQNDPSIKPFDEAGAWPIVSCLQSEIERLRKSSPSFPYAEWLRREFTNGRLQGYDVLLLDFPGNLVSGEYLQILQQKYIGLTVIPTEKDEMTIQSTIKVMDLLVSMKANHCLFINKAQLGLRNMKAQYMKMAEIFAKDLNAKILPDFVTLSDRMTTIDKVDIIRSTFGFPDFDAPTFKGSRDLGIQNLFIDITRLLKDTPDLKGTGTADLSFVDSLQKVDDGRQFKGSAFPEFEI